MDRRIRQAVAFIKGHFQKPIERKELAETAGLSPSRFSHLFRTETGTTPGEMVKSLRVQMAKDLLVTSRLRVKEIAARVGVNDESHFVRDFESVTGMSPTLWRRAHCDDPDDLVAAGKAAQSANKQHDAPMNSTMRQ
ncbi:MAG TPA: AraC family transcriptional regulator [Blastocatellia bacterium]